ncbi:MAG: HIT domain-containing protein [Bacteroidia bacterium]|nr:HIT domain-containing protein [Bacteroidia bacterium]
MKNKYYWLEVSGGCLAIGGRPGMNLIELLKSENCSTIVTLLKESERAIAEEIGNKASLENMDWVWLPLSASALPPEKETEKVRRVFATIKEKLTNGERIFIHCAAGIHRTGAFTYGLLRYLGNSGETAREIIKQLRPITFREAQDKHWNWGEQFGQEYNHIMNQNMEKGCVFCRIIQKELPASIVFENEQVMAIMDIQPINEGHVLVFPKECHPFLHRLPSALSQELFRVVTGIEKSLWHIEGIACEGTNLLQNNGRSAWQEINHVHFHIIPRFAGDNFKIKYQAKRPSREALNELSDKIRTQIGL